MKLIGFASLALLCLPSFDLGQALAQCSTSGLDDGPVDRTTGAITWKIYYTNDDPMEADYCTTAIANSFSTIINQVYDKQVTTFGFLTHHANNLPNIPVVISDSRNWGTFAFDCVTLDAPSVVDGPEVDNRGGMAHEMFHSIQYRYHCDGGDCNHLGNWMNEGMARCMDDRHFTDHDDITLGAFLWDEVRGTMNSTDDPLTDLSYRACLWWSYLCEQLGSTTTEPQYGIDFIKSLYERVSSDYSNGTKDGITSTGNVIRSKSSGEGFNELWHDYTIALIAREFAVGTLPNADRYRFVDEQPGGGGGPAYDDVDRAATYSSLPAQATNVEAKKYSSKYYEYTFDATECDGIGFRCTSNQDIAVSLLGITSDDKAILLSKGRGRAYGRVFINPTDTPISKLVAVVAGMGESSRYDYQFGSGNLSVSIERPNATRTAYAGRPGSPENVLARVYVEGIPELIPEGVGRRSVMGLQPGDFEASIDGLAAPVISASYVGGEYWLLLDAPDRPAGTYSLNVTLCGNASASAASSVEYGDRVAFHNIVIDNSGSMGYPTDAKMEAAKKAAKFYIDSVSDQDYIGTVRFSGNGSECDEDAKELVNRTLDPATSGNRQTHKDAVDTIGPDALTSVGDGVYLGYEMIKGTVKPVPTVREHILLLSDGLENEQAEWDGTTCVYGGVNVGNTIEASEVRVNTIALGPDSDQGLMQRIADETDGDYSYIDVSDSGAASVLSPGPHAITSASWSMMLRLAEGYLTHLQNARGLERLLFGSAETGGSDVEVELDLSENNVSDGVFFIYWEDLGSIPSVEILDATDTPIVAPTATIRQGDNHSVYHMNAGLPSGSYRLRLSTSESFRFFYGLLGNAENEVRLDVMVSQVNQPSANQETPTNSLYCQGVPVTILAMLHDKGGAIRKADVSVEVTLPTGEVACGPRTLVDDGNHGDGAAGDGVYGAVFTQTRWASRFGVSRDGGEGDPPGLRGSYRVEVLANGESNSSDAFTRHARTAFQIFTESSTGTDDWDGDGAGDKFEIYHGLNPFDPSDGALDLDEDGLTTREEFEQGTHPLDADTDNGGESDGSEVNAGRCPFDPLDDDLPPMTDVELITDTGCLAPEAILKPFANLLRFPVHPTYQSVQFFRADDTDPTNFQLVHELLLNPGDTGRYYDEGLVDGTEYYYKLRGVSAGGALTPFSDRLRGTAKADPIPPKGWLILNHNALLTDRRQAIAKIDVSQDATEFWIGTKSFDEASAPWQPIGDEYVSVDLGVLLFPGIRTVYHQLRDAAGNTSIIHRANIRYDPFGDFDGDLMNNLADDDDDADGADDGPELFDPALYTNPFNKDSDGDTLLDGFELSKGYSPRSADTDGDEALDNEEYALGLDANSRDTDGDLMPDGYELRDPDLDPNNPNDTKIDRDGDGHGALVECLGGTDPDDPTSGFDPIFTSPIGQTLRWPSAPGRVYFIDESPDLVTGWNQVAGPFTGQQDESFQEWLINTASQFFQVRVEHAP